MALQCCFAKTWQRHNDWHNDFDVFFLHLLVTLFVRGHRRHHHHAAVAATTAGWAEENTGLPGDPRGFVLTQGLAPAKSLERARKRILQMLCFSRHSAHRPSNAPPPILHYIALSRRELPPPCDVIRALVSISASNSRALSRSVCCFMARRAVLFVGSDAQQGKMAASVRDDRILDLTWTLLRFVIKVTDFTVIWRVILRE